MSGQLRFICLLWFLDQSFEWMKWLVSFLLMVKKKGSQFGKGPVGDLLFILPQDSTSDALELRFWASYRGQTLARTEREYSQSTFPTTEGFELSREARAQADLKFTNVLSCQIYGQHKQRKAPEAADISLFLQRI
ncbi:hypothetical protein AgCh_028528 [Apium graveolens]